MSSVSADVTVVDWTLWCVLRFSTQHVNTLVRVETKGFATLSLLWCSLPISWPSDTKRTPHRCVNILFSLTCWICCFVYPTMKSYLFFLLPLGRQVGEEMSKDLFLRPPDHQCSNKGWAGWAASTTLPAGCAGCRRDWLWEPRDCSLWVHVTGKWSELNSSVFSVDCLRSAQSKITNYITKWLPIKSN